MKKELNSPLLVDNDHQNDFNSARLDDKLSSPLPHDGSGRVLPKNDSSNNNSAR